MLKGKKTVFVLGAGASCPYGYPSGARLRELVCHNSGFAKYYRNEVVKELPRNIQGFIQHFERSHIKSIDLFMSRNPQLAPLGKDIVAFEILRAERGSCFAEKAKEHQEYREYCRSSDYQSKREHLLGTADFIGGDWCSFVYNRVLEDQAGSDALPDFSGGQLAFVTFNYDRSLEQFFYESLRHSFTEAAEKDIVESLSHLKIWHVYGQILPLRWQDAEGGVDYKPAKLDESLMGKAAANIRTIYEQKENPELNDAQQFLRCAEQIFFLGFGYSRENMNMLGLPAVIPPQCQVYGTAYGLEEEERVRVCASVHDPRKVDQKKTVIEAGNVDCLTLLRRHF
ncbi:MAG: hypothetical protein ABFD90_12900 [Phycisphaerales bacterium]